MSGANYLRKVLPGQTGNSAELSHSNLYDIIFRDCFFPVKRFVLSHGGSEDDLNDVLQDTFLIMTSKVKQEAVRDKNAMHAYIFGVARNLWCKELGRKKMVSGELDEVNFAEEVVDEADFYLDLQKRYNLYWKHFIRMGQECRKIIQAFIKKVETKEMSEKFGCSTENYYKKKSTCLKTLQTKIKQDPLYNRLNPA
jgi:DNA-directed RNA polymerase specialized sigma24 family protein